MPVFKIFLSLVLLSGLFLSPSVILAAGLVPCSGVDTIDNFLDSSFGTDGEVNSFIDSDECDIQDDILGPDGVINRLLEFIFKVLLVPLAAGVIVFAGVKMVINAGNPGKIEEAKKLIYNTVVGFVIVLSAYLIVKLIVTGLASDQGVGAVLKKMFPR